jgi:5-methylcytosine-specific restriction endonuclease McrA
MKKTKLPVSKIKKQCDKLVKEIVSIRDKDICQKCGERVYGSNRQRSHVIPVSAGNKLSFDPINLKVLCMHCHLYWWHKNPLEAREWFKEKFPTRYEYLMFHKGIKQMKMYDWVELKQKLEAELELLK